MQGARINKLLIGGGIAAAVLLAIVATLFYGSMKKHGLESKAVSHIATATAHLQDALADAAELYLVEAHAILRNRTNAARSRDAAVASRRALSGHIAAAGGRGAGWIQNALALKQRAERDSFDYRNALGTYAGLLQGHRDTQDKVRAVRPNARLLEDAQVQAGLKAAREAEQQAVADLERLRALVI